MMTPPNNFETSRLVLRQPELGDSSAIFENYAQDIDVVRYLIWKPHTSIKDTEDFLNRCLLSWDDQTAFPWVIIEKNKNELMGMLELRLGSHGAEVGYVLAKDFWNSGYMTEAVQEVVKWLLMQDDIYRIWAYCDVENTASAKVLEKVGMKVEGVLRNWMVHPNRDSKPRDCYCYSIAK